jgi:hypothetical protein
MDKREALDRLFAAPWSRFVTARGELAAELARDGHKDASRELKKVARPSIAAWGTNHVVREARAEVDAFLEASDGLRRDQAELLAGRGGQAAYQARLGSLRQATAALTQAARRALESEGRGADRHVVERIVANVRAAALVDERRRELLQGQLVRDTDAGEETFAALLGASGGDTEGAPRAPAPPKHATAAAPAAAPGAAAAKLAPASKEDVARRRREEEAARLEEARAAQLANARREEDDARQRAEQAEETATQARAARDEARAGLQEAQRAAKRAEQTADAADEALRRAQHEAAQADARLRAAAHRREALEKASAPRR